MKSIAKLGLVLLAAVSIVGTTTVRADDAASTTATTNAAPKHAGRKGGKMFTGKVASSDATAMTVTITNKKGDTQVVQLTSKTKIKKDGEPATLADVTAGASVYGMLRADASGTTNAVTLNIGQPKKAATSAAPATTPAQ